MARVWAPAFLRDLTGGQDHIQAEGQTVAEVIDSLERQYPGARQRLCDGPALRPNLAVVVDGQVCPKKLRQRVMPDSEVIFLAAISGGTGITR